MPKRLARKPSTASLTPAARNNRNAIRISPEVMAQITTGTSRMRASVMRLGMLTRAPRLTHRPCAGTFFPVFEYSGDRAVAQSAIPKYAKSGGQHARNVVGTAAEAWHRRGGQWRCAAGRL